LFIVVILAFVAFRKFKNGKQIGAVIALVAAGFTLWFYFAVDELPGQLVTMTPYIATILVMALASQRLRMPAADGIPYRRGGLR
jgi:simple sugar transport system permease protein